MSNVFLVSSLSFSYIVRSHFRNTWPSPPCSLYFLPIDCMHVFRKGVSMRLLFGRVMCVGITIVERSSDPSYLKFPLFVIMVENLRLRVKNYHLCILENQTPKICFWNLCGDYNQFFKYDDDKMHLFCKNVHRTSFSTQT